MFTLSFFYTHYRIARSFNFNGKNIYVNKETGPETDEHRDSLMDNGNGNCRISRASLKKSRTVFLGQLWSLLVYMFSLKDVKYSVRKF